jgi:RNA polymerase sigma-70 factor (ECF subfamily)
MAFQLFSPRGKSGPSLRLVSGATASTPAPADDDLVRAFEEGRAGSGADLYDRLLPVVDAAIVRVLGRRESDHDDLVQATFEQIVTTLSKRTFGRACSLRGWAAVLAYHIALNAVRSRRRERKVVDRHCELDEKLPIDPRNSVHPEAQLGVREDLAAVRRHLAEMSPDRAATLLLNAQGYSLEEIAALTNTSVAAAQTRLSRGRREIRERLGLGESPPPATPQVEPRRQL